MKKTYGTPLIEVKGEVVDLTETFKSQLDNESYRDYVEDILRLAQYNNEVHYEGQSDLMVYQKYSRKDFLKIKNFKNDESSTVYWYKVKDDMVPIFVTYHKQDDISETTQYEDEFLSQNEMKWFTRANRHLRTEEVQKILHHQAANRIIYLFVKKEDAEGTQFYYLGTTHVIKDTEVETTMPNGAPVVTMHLSLDRPVRDDIYRYLVKQ